MANFRGREQSAAVVREEFVPASTWTEDSTSHYLLVDLPGFKKDWLKLQLDEHSHHVLVSGEKKASENKIVRFDQTFKVPENSNIEKISARYEGEVLYVVIPKKVKKLDKGLQDSSPNHAQEKHEQIKGEEEEHEKGAVHHVGEKHEHEQVKGEEEENENGAVNHVGEKHKKAEGEEGEHEKGAANHDGEKHEHQEQKDDGGSHLDENDKNTKMAWEEGFWGRTGETWRQKAGLLGGVSEILSKNKGIVLTAMLAFSLGVFVSQKFQSTE